MERYELNAQYEGCLVTLYSCVADIILSFVFTCLLLFGMYKIQSIWMMIPILLNISIIISLIRRIRKTNAEMVEKIWELL